MSPYKANVGMHKLLKVVLEEMDGSMKSRGCLLENPNCNIYQLTLMDLWGTFSIKSSCLHCFSAYREIPFSLFTRILSI